MTKIRFILEVDVDEVSPQSLAWFVSILTYRGEGEELTATVRKIVEEIRMMKESQ